jgi:hypothetical protein
VLNGGAAPTASQVIARAGGAIVGTGGTVSLAANVGGNCAVTGLTASTAYDMYFSAKDASNNPQSTTAQFLNTTTAPPPTTNSFAFLSLTQTAITGRGNISANGTGYCAVVASGGAAPTSAQVIAGSGGGILFAGNVAMTAATNADCVVTGLSGNTAYDVYFAASAGGANQTTTSNFTGKTTANPMKSFGGYSIDLYEVTQNQYLSVVGSNPSSNVYTNCPVEQVTWQNAVDYCTAVGKFLPSDAQWTNAAQNGGATTYVTGSNSAPDACSNTGNGANYNNCSGTPQPIGTYGINANGLYDMGGNVWEWNTTAVAGGYAIRGGSWSIDASSTLLSSIQLNLNPSTTFPYLGFRCAQ